LSRYREGLVFWGVGINYFHYLQKRGPARFQAIFVSVGGTPPRRFWGTLRKRGKKQGTKFFGGRESTFLIEQGGGCNTKRKDAPRKKAEIPLSMGQKNSLSNGKVILETSVYLLGLGGGRDQGGKGKRLSGTSN